MPVYPHHRLVHIHIPKTAGTAVEQLLHGLDDMAWGASSLYGHYQQPDRWFELQHLTATELREHTSGAYDDFAAMAIVRDPYQRLISEYHWRKNINESNPDAFIQAFDSLEGFIDALPDDLDSRWETHIQGADMTTANVLIHARPQHHYTIGRDAEQDASIQIARYEDFPHSIDPILAASSIESHGLITRPPKNLRDHFTHDMVQKVNHIYARDFEAFDYPMVRALW